MSEITTRLRTVGISPKAVLAFLFRFIAACVATVIDWVNTGHFQDTAIRVVPRRLGGKGTREVAPQGR